MNHILLYQKTNERTNLQKIVDSDTFQVAASYALAHMTTLTDINPDMLSGAKKFLVALESLASPPPGGQGIGHRPLNHNLEDIGARKPVQPSTPKK